MTILLMGAPPHRAIPQGAGPIKVASTQMHPKCKSTCHWSTCHQSANHRSNSHQSTRHQAVFHWSTRHQTASHQSFSDYLVILTRHQSPVIGQQSFHQALVITHQTTDNDYLVANKPHSSSEQSLWIEPQNSSTSKEYYCPLSLILDI